MPQSARFFTSYNHNPQSALTTLNELIALQKKIYDLTLMYDVLLARLQHTQNRRKNAEYHYRRIQDQLQIKHNVRELLNKITVHRKVFLRDLEHPLYIIQTHEQRADMKLLRAARRSTTHLRRSLGQCAEDIDYFTAEYEREHQNAMKISQERIELTTKLQQLYQLMSKTNPESETHHQGFINLHPIFIKDILVVQEKNTYSSGEFTNLGNKDYLIRIAKQIEYFGELAYTHHKKICKEDKTLLPECTNYITRIITDEFSFYPSAPLTLEEYRSLLRAVHDIAQKLPENIHLLLSSFPVLDTQNLLHNITVHVTTGVSPILHHHSKARISCVDITYGHKKLAQVDFSTRGTRMVEINFNQELSFSFGSLVVSSTAAGSQLITNVELCKEHEYFTGISCLNREFKMAQQTHQLMPLQYSHIVSSRVIGLSQSAQHARIIQADAKNPGIWTRDPDTFLYEDSIPYNTVSLTKVFGQNSVARVYNPQPATFLPGRFFNKAIQHNRKVLIDEEKQFCVAPSITALCKNG